MTSSSITSFHTPQGVGALSTFLARSSRLGFSRCQRPQGVGPLSTFLPRNLCPSVHKSPYPSGRWTPVDLDQQYWHLLGHIVSIPLRALDRCRLAGRSRRTLHTFSSFHTPQGVEMLSTHSQLCLSSHPSRWVSIPLGRWTSDDNTTPNGWDTVDTFPYPSGRWTSVDY